MTQEIITSQHVLARQNARLRATIRRLRTTTTLLSLALIAACVLQLWQLDNTRDITKLRDEAHRLQIHQLETELDYWTKQAVKAQTAAKASQLVGAEYAGTYMATAYCCEQYEHICGEGHGITRSGLPVQAGVTVAADPDVLPLGSVIYIEGVGIRIVQDTGGAIKGNRIDVAVDTHDNALAWSGYGEHAVYILHINEEV